MKGKDLPLALANDIDRQLDGDYLDLDKIRTVLARSVDVMSLAAVAILMKDEFKGAYQVVSSIGVDDLAGWRSYLQEVLFQATSEVVGSTEFEDLPVWIDVAYAALSRDELLRGLDGTGGLRSFVEALDEAFGVLERLNEAGAPLAGLGRRDIQQIGTRSVSRIGDRIRELSDVDANAIDISAGMREAIDSDPFLKAAFLIHTFDVSRGRELIDKLLALPCVRSSCSFGGLSTKMRDAGNSEVLEAFFARFSLLEGFLRSDRIDGPAYERLALLIDDFAANENKAKGAVEALSLILRKMEENADWRLVGVEETQEILGRVNRAGETTVLRVRRYDFVFFDGERLIYCESKAWKPDGIAKYIRWALGAAEDVDDVGPAGQLWSDLTNVLRNNLDDRGRQVPGDRTYQWLFDPRMNDAGVTPDFLAEVVVDEIFKDRRSYDKLRRLVGNPWMEEIVARRNSGIPQQEDIDVFRKILQDMFIIEKGVE